MAFRVDSTDTYTYATNSTGGTVDLGARNNYRYVNATNVYNAGKAAGDVKHTVSVSYVYNNNAAGCYVYVDSALKHSGVITTAGEWKNYSVTI